MVILATNSKPSKAIITTNSKFVKAVNEIVSFILTLNTWNKQDLIVKSNNISIKNYYEEHLKIYRVYFALFWKYFRWKNINIDNEGFEVLLESLRIYCTIFLLLMQCCTCCIDYVSWKGYVVYTNLKMLAIWYILLPRSRATPR